MARLFRFAVQALDLADRKTVVAAARQAEALGYAGFYSYDHLGALDPFVPLVVAAEATSSLRVGPLVLNNELHHPALLARTAATVDRMTGGRLVLGMGTGYAQDEHDAMGIELRAPGPRIQRFEECLVALRSLLDTGSVEMDGRHHHLRIDDLGVRPHQERVPILVGGHGRRVIEAAAPLADIFQFTGLTHGADGTPVPSGFGIDTVTERARWLADAAGDRDGLIERSILVQATHLGVGAEEASDRAAARLGVTREVVTSTPFLLFGSVEQIVDKLESLREALGISYIVIRDAERFAPVVAALADR
jgi:probable F420-dependent oxidoreductase